MTIENYLENTCALFPDKVAVISEGEHITYSQLYATCMSRAQELASKGMKKGDIIPIRALPAISYLVDYFAIHLNGAIVVPLAKDLTDDEIQIYNEVVKGAYLPPDSADILFTTGTTGKSKGVIISHDTIIADAENLISSHGYTSDITFIISGPLNHCGCWSKVFPCIMKGATIILKDGIKDMEDFFSTISNAPTKVATFMVPSGLKILMQFGADRLVSLSDKIDFIETGGAPMPESDMKMLCSLLPNTRLYNTYASTESGIVATYDYNNGSCIFGCVGHSMKNSSVSISSDGQILCSGRTLMLGYLNDPHSTQAILKDGVLKMSDKGFIDDDGMLHISGRNDDVIITGAYKVDPTEVENIALEIPSIKDCICVPAPHPVMGTALKLYYVPEDNAEITKRNIALYLKSKLESYKIPLLYEVVESINMTYNGKKNRKSYEK